MRTKPVEETLTSHQLAEIRAALRVKGDSSSPSYAEIGKPFDLHPEQVRRIHKRMEAASPTDANGLPADPSEINMSDALAQMQRAIREGRSPTGLFAHIPRSELGAMMAGLARMLYINGKSPTTTLKVLREYGLLEGYYEQKHDTDPQRKRAIDMSDLARMEQETQEHLDAIRSVRKARKEARFLRKYGEEILEAEVEDVGSVGEEHGG